MEQEELDEFLARRSHPPVLVDGGAVGAEKSHHIQGPSAWWRPCRLHLYGTLKVRQAHVSQVPPRGFPLGYLKPIPKAMHRTLFVEHSDLLIFVEGGHLRRRQGFATLLE